MTALLPMSEAPNHHKPVECPFNADAECVCAWTLHEHTRNPAADPRNLHTWACPMRDGHFDPAPGEDLGCPTATDCSVCDVRICTDHSDGFSTCHQGPHHLDCALACRECTTTARTHP